MLHGYDIKLTGEQRQEIIDKKGFKDTPEHPADTRIRNFLQRIMDKILPEVLKERE